ncbi:MAG: hypothetical protein ACOC58_05560 [Chloroflexota bacterium]
MAKVKRTVERPWARKHDGGWVLNRALLLDSLKKGDTVQLDGITVGTRTLRKLVSDLPYDYCLLRANGRLEFETVETRSRRRNGQVRMAFQRPNHAHHWFAIVDGAWVPGRVQSVVVLQPRMLKRPSKPQTSVADSPV